MRKGTQPMTSGSIPEHLIRYSIPLILGDLFQLTYNMVDAIVVGKYAGPDALAAVGVASPLMSIAMFFIIGLGIGASVLMSEFYGAGDLPMLRREFATTLGMGAAFSTVVALGLFALTYPLLRLCNTPEEILPDTAGYLRIVALGMIVTSLYNILAAAFRSIGNTRTPLICLVAASLANVALDFWFVAGLHWGVRGAALATVISQLCSTVLCAAMMAFTARPLMENPRDFRVDRSLLRRTMQFSYASALQQAGIYVGRLLVQAMVNPLGVNAIAAFNAVNRIDDYAMIPERDISGGMMVFIAQNHGARKPARMREGFRIGEILECAYGGAISLAVFFLAAPLMRLFVAPEETEVLRLGTRYLRLMGLFYILPGITNGLQGFMRAYGYMKLTMLVTYSQMFTRALVTYLLIDEMGLDAVPLACVAGWVLMTVWEAGLMLRWTRRGTLFAMPEKSAQEQ